MSETPKSDPSPDTPPQNPGSDPVRRITWIVLAILLVYLGIHILADRQTPYTDQARVQSLVTPIVPRVSGYLTRVDIRLHSEVEPGDLLFEIDRRAYELAVRAAEANVDVVAQELGAQSESVKSAAAQLGVARAQLDRAQRNYSRTQQILEKNPGALSQADRDRAETALDQALERVASAEAQLKRAQEQLGAQGPDNARLRAAVAALEQARLDLQFTNLEAFDHGIIESFNVSVGHYAQSGQPLATFVSRRDQWIVADLKENNLGHVEAGDDVQVLLDVAPGRVFRGTVRSIGAGVSSEPNTNRGALPSVKSSSGWLRDPQRIPVIVSIDDPAGRALLRPGGQATVVVYTGQNLFLNTLAKVRIRVASWVSYVR